MRRTSGCSPPNPAWTRTGRSASSGTRGRAWSRGGRWSPGSSRKPTRGDEKARSKIEKYPNAWLPEGEFRHDFDRFVLEGTEKVSKLGTPQSVTLARADGRLVDFVGRTENFDDDLNTVRDKLGLERGISRRAATRAATGTTTSTTTTRRARRWPRSSPATSNSSVTPIDRSTSAAQQQPTRGNGPRIQ